MSTKTRPARKLRDGDVIDFGGQPFEVCGKPDPLGDDRIMLVGHTGGMPPHAEVPNAEVPMRADLLLDVQRRKKKAGPVSDVDAPPVPGRVYTLGPFAGPMPSVAELNAVFAEAIGTLLRERTE